VSDRPTNWLASFFFNTPPSTRSLNEKGRSEHPKAQRQVHGARAEDELKAQRQALERIKERQQKVSI